MTTPRRSKNKKITIVERPVDRLAMLAAVDGLGGGRKRRSGTRSTARAAMAAPARRAPRNRVLDDIDEAVIEAADWALARGMPGLRSLA
jgi:hypothetical protein